MNAATSLLLAALCLLPGAALAEKKKEQRKDPEVYLHRHTVIELEMNSPAWNQLSEAERRRYLATESYDGWRGKPAEADDILVLKRLPKGKALFCAYHIGHLLHACLVSGTGPISKDSFTYDEGRNGCKITLRFKPDGSIALQEKDRSCKDYCGFRASFSDDIGFSSRERLTDRTLIDKSLKECRLPQSP